VKLVSLPHPAGLVPPQTEGGEKTKKGGGKDHQYSQGKGRRGWVNTKKESSWEARAPRAIGRPQGETQQRGSGEKRKGTKTTQKKANYPTLTLGTRAFSTWPHIPQTEGQKKQGKLPVMLGPTIEAAPKKKPGTKNWGDSPRHQAKASPNKKEKERMPEESMK